LAYVFYAKVFSVRALRKPVSPNRSMHGRVAPWGKGSSANFHPRVVTLSHDRLILEGNPNLSSEKGDFGMKVTGFNHLTIRVSNLKKSQSFYCDVLGMKLVHQGRTDVYLEWGNAWICLVEKSGHTEPKEPWLGIDHVAFSIAEEDFAEAVQILKENQVPIIRGPLERGGGLSVQFLDPDGTVLELFTGSLEKRMKVWK
jgi:catechol 2,3-dioxygenase-like lactoylglutathione lyase family enzyme